MEINKLVIIACVRLAVGQFAGSNSSGKDILSTNKAFFSPSYSY